MSDKSKYPWWHESNKGMRHELVMQLVSDEYKNQMQRYQTMRRYIAVYEYGYKASSRLTTKEKWVDDTILYYNIAANTLDTYISQVFAPQISVMAMTEGGSYTDMDRAKLVTRAMQGTLEELDFPMLEAEAGKFFALCGAGFVKFCIVDGRLTAEGVHPVDILVDEMESRSGEPRCLYHRMPIDKYKAAEIFGEAGPGMVGSKAERKRKILEAKCFSGEPFDEDVWTSDDLVALVECWHLPSTPNSGDGRHSIVMDGITLLDEEWKHEEFPIINFRPKRSSVGFWGIPLMRSLIASQRERERMDRAVQRAARMTGGIHWLVSRDAQIAERSISNDSGTVTEYDGTMAPVAITPNPISQQMLDIREMIGADAMRYVGVSPLAAQSQVPAGLQQASGKALSVFEQSENKRNILDHKARERFNVKAANVVTMLIRDLIEENPDYSVDFARGKNMFERFRWKDVIMPEDECKFRVFPVASLSQNPSEKFQELETLLNAQLITPEQFKRLFGMPDIEGELELDGSGDQTILHNLDAMILHGKYITVEPFDSFESILRIGKDFYNACRRMDVPDTRLQLIRQYMTDAKAELDKVNAMQQPQQAPQELAAPGQPPPALPSGDVPNVG